MIATILWAVWQQGYVSGHEVFSPSRQRSN